jgi:hypothetical protein
MKFIETANLVNPLLEDLKNRTVKDYPHPSFLLPPPYYLLLTLYYLLLFNTIIPKL